MKMSDWTDGIPVSLFVQKPDEDFNCGVCHDVLNKPVQVMINCLIYFPKLMSMFSIINLFVNMLDVVYGWSFFLSPVHFEVFRVQVRMPHMQMQVKH